MDVFSDLHPTAAGRIDSGSSVEEHALNFVEKVSANKAKSKLAHSLALRLENDEAARSSFTIPIYISNAIKWVVGESINV